MKTRSQTFPRDLVVVAIVLVLLVATPLAVMVLGYVVNERASRGEIVGRVARASDGAPIAGAVVATMLQDDSLPPPVATTTGADGRYSLVVDDGEQWVMARLPPSEAGLAPKVVRVEVVGGELATADFALERGGRVAVEVVDAEGAPVAGVAVDLEPVPAARFHPLPHGKTDQRGVVSFEDVARGAAVAEVWRDVPDGTTTTWSDELVVEPGAEARRRVTLEKRFALRVRCAAVERPDSLLWIRARDAMGRRIASADGSERRDFTLWLPRGRISVSASTGLQEAEEDVVIGDDPPKEVVVKLEAIPVKVR
ncbi:MAG TPA: carboxypeptidase-like regulatory domain-containing protein [Planctomycetota bacterium]|nr:carboxypeptidase-like regulatory domain-containing protein [Planctomycetota bacterium]